MKQRLRHRQYRLAYLRRLAGIVAAAVTVIVVWYLFVFTHMGQAVDTLAMFMLAELNRDLFDWDQILLREAYWFLVVPTLGLALVVSLWRRRWGLAVRMIIMVGLSAYGVQLLKHWILVRPALGITFYMDNSYPSGHTAVAAAGAAALVMVSASRWRVWLTHLMALYLVVVGLAVTVAQWHRPSDVFGSICVTAFFTLLLTPVEDNPRALKTHDAQGRRRYLLSASSCGVLVTLIGIAITGWATYSLKSSVHFSLGTATQDLRNLASQYDRIALSLALATVLLYIGFAWATMGEIGQLSRNRASAEKTDFS